MKPNKIERKSGSRGVLVAAGAVLLVIAAIGLSMAYTTLRNLYSSQCIVTDAPSQVVVTSGKLVKGDAVAEALGLRNGTNLAETDFSARRQVVRKKYPAIRDISITRQLPNRVTIHVEEREPAVRLNICGRKGDTGRVADADGVVFQCRRGTGLLPTIREAQAPGTAAGRQLQGRAMSALRLAGACRDQEFQELGLLEIDLSKADYLTATLGSYKTAKIAWEGMDESSESSRKCLIATLRNLRDAIRANIDPGITTWNATCAGRVYADTKEKIR